MDSFDISFYGPNPDTSTGYIDDMLFAMFFFKVSLLSIYLNVYVFRMLWIEDNLKQLQQIIVLSVILKLQEVAILINKLTKKIINMKAPR